MAMLVHTAPARRKPSTIPAVGRYWKAARNFFSRVFSRIANAVYASRSKRAQREIAQRLVSRGMPLTDAGEREIAARLMGGGWNVRR